MAAAAGRTKDAELCVTAKNRNRRVALPVIRRLLPARPRPRGVPAEGRRGTKARSTAAHTAGTAPVQSRLESTLASSARPEDRAGDPASIAANGWGRGTAEQ